MINCPKCDGDEYLEVTETDSRQEWTEETLFCPSCERVFTKRTDYNQGLIISETLEEVKNERKNIPNKLD